MKHKRAVEDPLEPGRHQCARVEVCDIYSGTGDPP